MTWEEWVDSEYNTGDFTDYSDAFIYFTGEVVSLGSTFVHLSDIILENGEYSMTFIEHIGGGAD